MTSNAHLDVHDLLEEAAGFARAGDLTAAVARAKAATRGASDGESYAEACLALERFEMHERAWRAAIDAREAAYLLRERKEAEEAARPADPPDEMADDST